MITRNKNTTDVSMFNEGLTDIKMRVARILASNPMVRSNDVVLVLDYWERFHGLSKHIKPVQAIDGTRRVLVDPEFWQYATHPEIICRWRRKFNEQKHFLPSREIQEKRREAAEKMRGRFNGKQTMDEKR